MWRITWGVLYEQEFSSWAPCRNSPWASSESSVNEGMTEWRKVWVTPPPFANSILFISVLPLSSLLYPLLPAEKWCSLRFLNHFFIQDHHPSTPGPSHVPSMDTSRDHLHPLSRLLLPNGHISPTLLLVMTFTFIFPLNTLAPDQRAQPTSHVLMTSLSMSKSSKAGCQDSPCLQFTPLPLLFPLGPLVSSKPLPTSAATISYHPLSPWTHYLPCKNPGPLRMLPYYLGPLTTRRTFIPHWYTAVYLFCS